MYLLNLYKKLFSENMLKISGDREVMGWDDPPKIFHLTILSVK